MEQAIELALKQSVGAIIGIEKRLCDLLESLSPEDRKSWVERFRKEEVEKVGAGAAVLHPA